jgi:hypothetical protein
MYGPSGFKGGRSGHGIVAVGARVREGIWVQDGSGVGVGEGLGDGMGVTVRVLVGVKLGRLTDSGVSVMEAATGEQAERRKRNAMKFFFISQLPGGQNIR